VFIFLKMLDSGARSDEEALQARAWWRAESMQKGIPNRKNIQNTP
jgi:hypothetical protein